MKRAVCLFSINYSPEVTGFSQHVAMFAAHLAKRGFAVTVCTGFPFAPNWQRWPAYKGRFILEEWIDGVRVIRHSHFIPKSPRRAMERLLMESSFCISILPTIMRLGSSFDIFIYVGAQPSVSMLARLVGNFFRIPYVIMINDVASGAAADVGILKPGLLSTMLSRFEFSAYAGAAGATVLCKSFKELLVSNGFPADHVILVRSPVDIDVVRPQPKSDDFRVKHGILADDFVVLFAGSMGLKQGMTNIVESARLVAEDCPDVKWILVGDGETRPEAVALIHRYGLGGRVKIVPFQPAEMVSEMFGSADVLLLNQLRAVKDSVIPSKLLTYMAAGKPVIAAVNESSQGAELLRVSGGGWVVLPENALALAEAVRKSREVRSVLRPLGEANRRYALANFDARKVSQSLEQFVCRYMSTGSSSQKII